MSRCILPVNFHTISSSTLTFI